MSITPILIKTHPVSEIIIYYHQLMLITGRGSLQLPFTQEKNLNDFQNHASIS